MKYLPIILFFAIVMNTVFLNGASASDVDIKPIEDFIEFMKLCETAPAEMRYALWHKHYYEPNADALQKMVFKTADEAKIKKSMLKALDNIFANYRLHYETLVEFKRNFSNILAGAEKDFKKYFPEAAFDDISFHAFVGNQSFNARADMVDGAMTFEIAAEMFDGADGVRLTLMHELFHLYHMKCFEKAGNKIEERLYFPLIFEGCAVYFSLLSTGREIEDGMRMGLPGYLKLFDETNFRKKCEKTFIKSAESLLENMDVPVTEETYKNFFGTRIDNTDEPCRIGYYIGFKLIDGIAAEIPLEKIANMNKKEIIRLCRTRLSGMIRK